MKKILITIVATVLVCACIVGGTAAWLMDKTDAVTNTFTVGNISITLTESDDLDLKIIPGKTITKDPVVTVEANSEACWLFVKITKTNWPDGVITYSMGDGWTKVTPNEALGAGEELYVIEVDATTANTGKEYPVIAGNTMTIANTVTKTQIDAITNDPTLVVQAYAVQKDAATSAADAWDLAKNDANY